jgi:hypothetical protein
VLVVVLPPVVKRCRTSSVGGAASAVLKSTESGVPEEEVEGTSIVAANVALYLRETWGGFHPVLELARDRAIL